MPRLITRSAGGGGGGGGEALEWSLCRNFALHSSQDDDGEDDDSEDKEDNADDEDYEVYGVVGGADDRCLPHRGNVLPLLQSGAVL